MAEEYDDGPYSTDDSGDDLMDSGDDMMDTDHNEVNLAAIMKKLKSDKEVKDALVYGWGSIQNEEDRRIAKISSLLGLQDGSTSAPPLDDICMPESALRGDDVSYENMKASVEKCFGLHNLEGDGYVVHSFLSLLDSNDILQDVRKHLRSIIKSMSCTGLLRFAKAVTGGSVLYEKSRPKMREIILKYYKKILQNPGHRNNKRFIEELPKLLKNPSNFEIKITGDVQVVDPAYLSPHSAAIKILEVLKEEKKKGMDCQEEKKKCMDCKPLEGKKRSMDCHLLSAMIRRLKGDVKEPKFGDVLEKKYTNRTRLIEELKKAFVEELRKVSAGEEFSIGLVKAMSVAVLGLNMSSPEIFVPAFGSDCPLKLVIHEDLLKCIRILSDNKLKDVKELRTVLDPISICKLKPQKFQEALRKWLIEYLYEYPELELVEIPEPVKKTIDIIMGMNQDAMVPKSPTLCIKHEQANKELEIVGNLSAQFKQIMLDKNCDHNMDEDYNDAYFKDLEVNSYDEYDNLSKDGGNHSDESVGECEADGSVLPESTSGGNAFTLEDMGQDSSDGAGKEQKPVNKYLAIQENCDNRSLRAHSLIGHLLEKLLDEEGAELDGSKRLYLRGGRSDHQEDCAGTGR
ncbi:hypothetical protein MKW92_004761 [Papaver armeniacum]|nr:hypothetical protein MKW92_004761 [Papaver armeniacum]